MGISLKRGHSIEYKVRKCFLFAIFNVELRCLCVRLLHSLRERHIFAQVGKKEATMDELRYPANRVSSLSAL